MRLRRCQPRTDTQRHGARLRLSVLDDNRCLSLPTGERLRIHRKLTIVFECRNLAHASAASVSRCGVVWLGGESAPLSALLSHARWRIDRAMRDGASLDARAPAAPDPVREEVCAAFGAGGCVETAVRLAVETSEHIMPFSASKAVHAARALAEGVAAEAREAYREALSDDAFRAVLRCRLLLASFWAAAAGLSERARVGMSKDLVRADCARGIPALPAGASLADVHVSLDGENAGSWCSWAQLAPEPTLAPEDAGSPDCVVPTSDTVRHEWLVDSWLSRVPLTILCGPPGTGKTMTLTAALSRRTNVRLVTLPCSSATSAPAILGALREVCEETSHGSGQCTLQPRGDAGGGGARGVARIVLFLDEVNLCKTDTYGTQSAVEMLRQLATRGGFWEVRPREPSLMRAPHARVPPARAPASPDHPCRWVGEVCRRAVLTPRVLGPARIQIGAARPPSSGGSQAAAPKARFVRIRGVSFVCACNPATDAGRTELNPRLLASAPVVYVGAPTKPALRCIYGAFAEAALRPAPELAPLAPALAAACLDAYHGIAAEFCGDAARAKQAHYVTSPRELSRWIRGVRGAVTRSEGPPDGQGMVRAWLHAATAMFRSRLVSSEERGRCDRILDEAARRHFGALATPSALQRPIVMPEDVEARGADALSRPPTAQDVLEHFDARAASFAAAEGMDRPVVMFEAAIDALLNMCSTLRTPLGHLMLLGPPGSGRALLSRLAAHVCGLRLVRINAHRRYTAANFEEDLRDMLLEAGGKGTPTLFLFDEANALDSSFLERLNALLTSGEVPGLFSPGEEMAALVATTRQAMQLEGAQPVPEDDAGVYRAFVERARTALHVVFTMNPADGEGFKARAAASPALISRCVVQWFGDWPPSALLQVARAMVDKTDLSALTKASAIGRTHDSICDALVRAHAAAKDAALGSQAGSLSALAAVTPRAFVELCSRFSRELRALARQFDEDEAHLLGGLSQLRSTEKQMVTLRSQLKSTARDIRAKDAEAAHTRARMEREGASAASAAAHADAAAAVLARKSSEVDAAQAKAKAQLAEAEPAASQARAGVRAIQRSQLDELRALKRPPGAVHLAIEATMLLLHGPDGGEDGEDGEATPNAKGGGTGASATPTPSKRPQSSPMPGDPLTPSTGQDEENMSRWRALLRRMKGAEFIAAVLNFDAEGLADEVCDRFEADFESKEEFDPTSVRRASRACGHLAQWCIAQVKYARALRRSAPLRAEVTRLEGIASEAREKLDQARLDSDRLQARVANLAEELEGVTLAREKLAQQAAANEARLERLERLREALKAEESRWASEGASMEDRKRALAGSAALRACFLVYGGSLGASGRARAVRAWTSILAGASPVPLPPRVAGGVDAATSSASLAEAIAGPERLAAWASSGLAAAGDRAAAEAAVAIERAERTPFVLDPTGEVVAGLIALAAQERTGGGQATQVDTVSALSDGFVKSLESAMRFGTRLIVRDADALDPILNPYLNGDVRKVGGRRIVRLGAGDVEVSPSFRLILASERDTASALPGDVVARVTLVDAAATPPAVAERCLARAVSVERPALEERRNELSAQVASLAAKQRALEHDLLVALAQAPSSMVEDDSLAAKLEALTSEAQLVTSRVQESEALLRTVEEARAVYRPLGNAAGLAYQALGALPRLHALYQFPMDAFMAIFDDVIRTSDRGGGDGVAAGDGASDGVRVEALALRLLRQVCDRARTGMLERHHLPLAVAMAAARAEARGQSRPLLAALRVVAGFVSPAAARCVCVWGGVFAAAAGGGGGGGGNDDDRSSVREGLAQEEEEEEREAVSVFAPAGMAAAQWQSVLEALPDASLARVVSPALAASADGLERFLAASDAEARVPPPPEGWASALASAFASANVDATGATGAADDAHLARTVWELLLVRALRVDRLTALLSTVVESQLGEGASVAPDVVGALDEITKRARDDARAGEVRSGAARAARPVLLACVTGVDGGDRIAEVAASNGHPLVSVAAGGDGGDEAAGRALGDAAREGAFCVLRNVHLAPSWLPLVKRFLAGEGAEAAPGFRLFLTMEIGVDARPVVQLGFPAEVKMLEPAPGIKHAIRRSLAAAPLLPAAASAGARAVHACRPRVRLLLAWLHAALNERCRYWPAAGFGVRYDFGDADERAALRLVDSWLAAGAEKVGGEEEEPTVRWDALRGALLSAAYGGRVERLEDAKALEELVGALFVPAAADARAPFDVACGALLAAEMPAAVGGAAEGSGVESGGGVCAIAPLPPLVVGEGGAAEDAAALRAWVEALPDHGDAAAGAVPVWIGLPSTAERGRLEAGGRGVLGVAGSMGACVILGGGEVCE